MFQGDEENSVSSVLNIEETNPLVALPSVFTASNSLMPSASVMGQTERTHEYKFLVPRTDIESVLDCARTHLPPDPNADPEMGDGYSIHTLYFDTDQFDVFYQQGPYRNAKYRIRRYNAEEVAYLERKSKPQGRVRKHRTQVPLTALEMLQTETVPDDWAGRWFRRRLQKRNLKPVCQLSYNRTARVGYIEGHPVRFTLDRQVQCAAIPLVCAPEKLGEGTPVFPNEEAVVEMKFVGALPEAFGTLMNDLNLSPSSMSKYRMGIRTLGLAANTDRRQDAA